MNVKPLFQTNESPTITEYLRRCGIDTPNEYLNISWVEDYGQYKRIESGVQCLEEAIEDDGRIILICDSDCDGYCATTIAYQFLINEGVDNERITIFFHDGKQHGFSKDILTQINLVINRTKVSLIWMPDAGTNDNEAHAFYECCYGIPILITDHHQLNHVGGLSENAIIINNQTSDGVTNKYLCGAGVTHKLVTAYCMKHNSNFHQTVIDLVALATIGDVMDIRNMENRTIIKWGLKHIKNPFFKAMCEEFILGEVTPTSVAWNIVPKINAVCRMGSTEMKTSLCGAFCVKGWNIDSDLSNIKKCHSKQREDVNIIYEQLLNDNSYIGDKVKIFITQSTPYTGLIATKLSEHFNCPCMVVHENDGEYTGSLRSPCEMRSKLQSSGLMTICAGHEQACGVGWLVNDTDELSSFCRQLDLSPSDKIVMYSYDDVFIDPMVFDITKQGASLWGTGIPEPTIHLKNITINGQYIKEIGANKTTIKFLYGDIEIIGFFMSKEKKKSLHVGEDVNMSMEIIGTPTINTFRDKDTKQIVIKEWEICQK